MIKWISNKVKSLIEYIRKLTIDDELRQLFMFKWLNIILSFVSLFMTIVNIFTKEWPLMFCTLIFGILAMLNALVLHHKSGFRLFISVLFFIEIGVLLIFFTITGHPNGFSVLWISLIPSFVLFLFGRKNGSIICGVTFLIVTFLFWIPIGKELLQYNYGETFLLRFPFLFAATYFLSLFIETIRAETQRNVLKAEEKYKFLYCHDALTNLCNRYFFNETIQQTFSNEEINHLSLMIIDVDNFKMVNDEYGHDIGDEVLKQFAVIMKDVFCEHCFYSRWGGEEFTALLTCNHDSLEIAQRLRKTVDEYVWKVEEYQLHITISIGLCIVKNKKNTNISAVLKTADQCLYKAKKEGKNCVISEVIE